MQTRKVLLFTVMVLALLNSSGCAVKVKDEMFCSPMPLEMGAVCDNFLSSNQQILDENGWDALQDKWLASGQAIECTSSTTLGDIKSEIEKLCSIAPCDYQTKKKILSGLTKLQALGKVQAQAVLFKIKGE